MLIDEVKLDEGTDEDGEGTQNKADNAKRKANFAAEISILFLIPVAVNEAEIHDKYDCRLGTGNCHPPYD